MTEQAFFEALRASQLGTELSDDQARTLATIVAFRDLAQAEVLVAEGTSDNHLYVIVKGVLGVIRNAGKDEPVTLFTLGAGENDLRAFAVGSAGGNHVEFFALQQFAPIAVRPRVRAMLVLRDV